MPSFSEVAQIGVILEADGGQKLVLQDWATGRMENLALCTNAPLQTSNITTRTLGTMRAITLEEAAQTLDETTLSRFTASADFCGTSATTRLNGNAFCGDIVRLEPLDLGALTLLAASAEERGLFATHGAALNAVQLAPDPAFGVGNVLMPDPVPQSSSNANDLFEAGRQPETIDGGAGIDTVSFALSPGAVIVDLGDDSKNAGVATGFVLRGIEALIGTPSNDRLTGDRFSNLLTGLDGNDRLWGMGGNDWITPGHGRDSIDGGDGIDMISFSDQNQTAVVNLTNGLSTVGRDTKEISNVENVTGTIHADFLTGDAGANFLRGLGGYDWFIATEGADTYDGSNGRDMVSYINAPTGVTLDLAAQRGLAGLAVTHTYVQVERVTGSIHADVFHGSDGEDEFRGAGGYDWFIDSPRRDRYDGGSGQDTVAYLNATSGVNASLLRGSGGPSYDLYTSIENLTGSSFADVLIGDYGRNTLRGLFGDDRLFGLGGNDRLEGGASDDYLDGGPGYDVAIFSGNRRDYVVNSSAAFSTVTHLHSGRDGTDTLVNIEVLSFADGFIYL